MARVTLDADVVIAFLDPSDAQHEQAVELLREHLASGDDILIAATVYAEVIVKPLQHGTDGTVDQFLAAVGAHVVDVDRALARRAAGCGGATAPCDSQTRCRSRPRSSAMRAC